MSDDDTHMCPETNSSVCAFHSVELERRKTDRGGIQELRQKIETRDAKFNIYKKETEKALDVYKEKIYTILGRLEIFRGRMLVAGTLGLILILGSYSYIGIHQASADTRYYNLVERLVGIDQKALLNKENMAVLTSKLETTNERLKEMIDLLRSNEINQVPRG